MSRPLQFHQLFERLIPPFASVLPENARIFTLKVERRALCFSARTFVDAVLIAGERFYALPFVDIHGGVATFPQRAAAWDGPRLIALREEIETWVASKPAEADMDLDLLGQDDELRDALFGEVLIPGFVPLAMLTAEIDRYSAIENHSRGRKVLIFGAGAGLGAAYIARFAAGVDAVSDDSVSRRAAARGAIFPVADRPGDAVYDIVFLPRVAASDVQDLLARARTISPQARICVTLIGSEGKAALGALGADITPLIPPGLDLAADEYAAWFEPPQEPRSNAVAIQEIARPALVSARPLRILFPVRPAIAQGGDDDLVRIEDMVEGLRARGHEVRVNPEAQPDPSGFDVVNLTNLNWPKETLAQALACAGVPRVLTPMYLDLADETAWGAEATACVLGRSHGEEQLREFLDALANRRINIPGSQFVRPPQRSEIAPSYSATQRAIIQNCDYLLANAHSEIHRIFRYLDCRKPFSIVPTSVDSEIYHPEQRAAFVAKFGLEDFVLTSGNIEPRKNQALIAKIANDLPEHTFVLIGNNYEPWYGEIFRAYWPRNLFVLPNLAQSELAGAYAAARVVCLPSWDGDVRLAALRAAACGASLVLTRNGYEHEYVLDDAYYCDPGDDRSIAAAIGRAWGSHARRAERRHALRERVREQYSASRSAEMIEAIYYQLVADRVGSV